MTTSIEWATAAHVNVAIIQPFDVEDADGTSNTTTAIAIDNGSSTYVIEGDVRTLRRLALRILAHTVATLDHANGYANLPEVLAGARNAIEDAPAPAEGAAAALARLVAVIDPDDSL